MLSYIVEKFRNEKSNIQEWIYSLEEKHSPLLYFSTDIRDSCMKVAVVDGNVFPAGFNNLNSTAHNYASHYFKRHINRIGLNPKNKKLKVLFFIESATRNLYYLENCRSIINILRSAEMQVICVADFKSKDIVQQEWNTASGSSVIVYNIALLKEVFPKSWNSFHCIISNNDLVDGIPEYFDEFSIPIVPPLEAGWHSRRKSTHFDFYSELLNKLSKIIDIDPWLLSAQYKILNNLNINQEKDQEIIYENAAALFQELEKKYKEYSCTDEKPFLFLKSIYGTYGMGILKVNSPESFLQLNRKQKNKLSTGKGSIPVKCYILQEGVPTKYTIDNHTAEVCIYHVDNQYVGSFFRMNQHKNKQENLNSKNSIFRSIDFATKQKQYINEDTFYVYNTLSRILAIASKQEIDQLLNGNYNEACLLDRHSIYVKSS